MPIRAVLFDKDGTLVDFDATWGPAALAVMRRFAGDNTAALARLIEVSHYDLAAGTMRPTSPLLAGAAGDYGPLWADAVGRPLSEALLAEIDVLFAEEGLASLTPIGAPAEVLARLAARGLALGLCTNDSESGGRAQMEALGLARHLGFIAGWDSGHGRKPAPGPILAFARAVGVPPREVAVVGDTLHDLAAARAAGALAVAVLTGPRGAAARTDLAPHADHVLVGLDDLPALLERVRDGHDGPRGLV